MKDGIYLFLDKNCEHCEELLESIKKNYPEILKEIIILSIQNNPELFRKFDIMSVPFVAVIKNNRIVKKHSGSSSLLSALKKFLDEDNVYEII